MKEFTAALYELFVSQNISLSQSLLIMSRKPKKDCVSRAASLIYASLENGSIFSNALKACGAISFDESYVSFIRLAEKNGDLKSAVIYLKKKLERNAEDKKRLIGVSVYPAFVLLLSVAACVFIGVYTGTADFKLLAKYLVVLFFICALIFFLIVKMLASSRLYEAFTAVDFLLRNGIELSEAVGCAVQVAGPCSKVGRLFENARLRLSYGMDLQSAFRVKAVFGGGVFSASSKLTEAFYYADLGGSREDMFGRIASYLASEKEKSRLICLSLVEPVFIVITGGFLLIILMTFFMPLINNISWI